MVVGVALREFDLGAELGEGLLETLGNRDAAERADFEALKIFQRADLAGDEILQVLRAVGALDDVGGAVVAADAADDLGVVRAVALREKNVGGAAEVRGRLAEGSAREHVLVAERRLPVDERDLKAVAHFHILEAVIEDQHIGPEFLNRVDATAHAVAVNENDNAAQVVCEHERLVARRARIEKERDAIRNNAGSENLLPARKAVEDSQQKRLGNAFVATAQDRHAAAALLEGAGEHFDDGSFSRATDGEVAHADDEHTVGVTPENAVPVECEAGLDDGAVDFREAREEDAQDTSALARAALEDDIDGEGFEALDPASHLRTRAPWLSARRTIAQAASRPQAEAMALATRSGRASVAQATAEPAPLSQPPSAPAAHPASITRSRNGRTFAR